MQFISNINNINELPESANEGDVYVLTGTFIFYVRTNGVWVLHRALGKI